MCGNRERKKEFSYEEPSVQIAYLDFSDVLTESTDVGEEYPKEWE